MKKLVIYQPRIGRSKEDMDTTTQLGTAYAQVHGYDIIDTLLLENDYLSTTTTEKRHKNVIQIPLYLLSRSLELLSKCDVVYFSKDYNKFKESAECYQIAKRYNLEIVIEE